MFLFIWLMSVSIAGASFGPTDLILYFWLFLCFAKICNVYESYRNTSSNTSNLTKMIFCLWSPKKFKGFLTVIPKWHVMFYNYSIYWIILLVFYVIIQRKCWSVVNMMQYDLVINTQSMVTTMTNIKTLKTKKKIICEENDISIMALMAHICS